MKSLKGKTIYFWWSCSEVVGITFEKWIKMRMSTGQEDSNKIGVGVQVKSDWLFSKDIIKKIPHGLKRGQYRVRPYTELYRTRQAALQRKHPIKRPAVSEI